MIDLFIIYTIFYIYTTLFLFIIIIIYNIIDIMLHVLYIKDNIYNI